MHHDSRTRDRLIGQVQFFRIFDQVDESATDRRQVICRRKVVRLCHDRIRMRRCSSVLLSSKPGTSTVQQGDRSSTSQMERADGDCSTDEPQIRSRRRVLIASGSQQSGSSAIAPGIFFFSAGRTFTFSNTVIAYTPMHSSSNVYLDARRGPCMMQRAVDRCRFWWQIKQIEVLLNDIFCDAHGDELNCHSMPHVIKLNDVRYFNKNTSSDCFVFCYW